MTFSLSILLFIYGVFLLIWGVFSLVALYHMFRFGFLNFTTFFTTFIYIVVAALIIFESYKYISQIGWGLNVTILENFFSNWFSLGNI
jgi:hypothetical protein